MPIKYGPKIKKGRGRIFSKNNLNLAEKGRKNVKEGQRGRI